MRSKIHDTRIEERIAAFDRVGHGDAVALRRQQVARQQMRSFEILALAKRIPVRVIGRQRRLDFGHAVVARERCPHGIGQEHFQAGRQPPARQM